MTAVSHVQTSAGSELDSCPAELRPVSMDCELQDCAGNRNVTSAWAELTHMELRRENESNGAKRLWLDEWLGKYLTALWNRGGRATLTIPTCLTAPEGSRRHWKTGLLTGESKRDECPNGFNQGDTSFPKPRYGSLSRGLVAHSLEVY